MVVRRLGQSIMCTGVNLEGKERELTCAVVIPTHKPVLVGSDLDSFMNTLQTIKDRDIYVVTPSDLNTKWFDDFRAQHQVDFRVCKQKIGFLGSIENYNLMALSTDFYRQFENYDYILIVHLDAYVLRDELQAWINLNYDYIGAPLFLPRGSRSSNLWSKMAPQGGNGGFSLRKISRMIEITNPPSRSNWNWSLFFKGITYLLRNSEWRYLKIFLKCCYQNRVDPTKFRLKNFVFEDVMISIFSSLRNRRIRVAPAALSVGFCLEVNAPEIMESHLSLKSPFGIHGYDKYMTKEEFENIRSNHSLRESSYTFAKEKKLNFQGPLPKVTIITIVKDLYRSNRFEQFEQSLNSVINQTYSNIEFLVIDGASTDGTLEKLKLLCKGQKFILHSQPDSGVWDAMDIGLAKATGDLVNYMNSDDYFIETNAVEKLVRKLSEESSHWIFSGARVEKLDGSQYSFPSSLEGVFSCMGIVHQAILVDIQLLKSISPFRSSHITKENYLMMRLLRSGFEPSFLDEELVLYREGGFSTSHYGGENLERTKRDFALYFYETFGQFWNFTLEECYYFFGWSCFSQIGVVKSLKMSLKIRRVSLRNDFQRKLVRFVFDNFKKEKIIKLVILRICRYALSKVYK
jgi:glycosyltransferase involved in cell wall biosynthesis